MHLHFPIGLSNFRELIETRDSETNAPWYTFVDKTLLIKEMINDKTKVKVITRPRRFGKTLSLSMLHHFFAKEVDGQPTAPLFQNLKISQYSECMKEQGKYPVIFLSLKDIKKKSWEKAYKNLCIEIRRLYEKHEELVLNSDVITEAQKNRYRRIIEHTAPEEEMSDSLLELINHIGKIYGQHPYVLIDEYDTPIQTAYLNGYYDDMIEFMKIFLGKGLKDNDGLHRAVVTGILRVAKEGLFSGLNNVEPYSILEAKYSEYFGFTESEVYELLVKAQLDHKLDTVKEWYNGYQFGGTTIYNPWSLIQYLNKKGLARSYWINTSNNELIKDIIIKCDLNFKSRLELLLQGKSIGVTIQDHLTFKDLISQESHKRLDEMNFWTLFLMSGYLKATQVSEDETYCQVSMPNKEIRGIYKQFIATWILNSEPMLNAFLQSLLKGEMQVFESTLQSILENICSTYDVKSREPETFFHGLLLGLVAELDAKDYTVTSNRESGEGRYDILIEPKNLQQYAIVMEIKSVRKSGLEVERGSEALKLGETLKPIANKALIQINVKNYAAILSQSCFKQHIKIGVAFHGKKLAVAYEKVNYEKVN